jgi:F-type H+-transporting ATPase subunit alpha
MERYHEYKNLTNEVGVVTYARFPLIVVKGLPGVRVGELIMCESGQIGEVFLLDHDDVEVLLFDPMPVRVGTEVVRTNAFVTVPVGNALLGRLLDAFGRPLDKGGDLPAHLARVDLLPRESTPLFSRKRITEQLFTGVSVVDVLLPLAKGQRELIVGDRKTGKTSFLQSVVLSQVAKDVVIVYAAIGKKQSEISRLANFFFAEKERAEKIVCIASHSMESASLIYMTPYTAMTVAEYFAAEGRDVIVVLDDLSTHAKFYREVSLIARRFPGRESYPGDIFYVHSRLLERAGAFASEKNKQGMVTITCLPVVETVEGDITGYISTNLMGMTDGHLYFDLNVFNEGRRPAINIPLSVTRVGKQTQSVLLQEIQRRLTAFLSEHEKISALSHFGAELSRDVWDTIRKGNQILKLLDQHYTVLIPIEVQIVILGLVWHGFMLEYSDEDLLSFRNALVSYYNNNELIHESFGQIMDVSSFDEYILGITKIKEQLLNLWRQSQT